MQRRVSLRQIDRRPVERVGIQAVKRLLERAAPCLLIGGWLAKVWNLLKEHVDQRQEAGEDNNGEHHCNDIELICGDYDVI